MPFALSKINRVSYGILSSEQLRRSRAASPASVSKARCGAAPPPPPRTPAWWPLLTSLACASKARTLLAVPFLGKDAPSRASEFSHADVAICLTTLACRYDGLVESGLHPV